MPYPSKFRGQPGPQGPAGDGFNWQGVWKSGKTYLHRDVVRYENILWINIEPRDAGVVGIEPGSGGSEPIWNKLIEVGPPLMYSQVGALIGVLGGDFTHPDINDSNRIRFTFPDNDTASRASEFIQPLTRALGPVSGTAEDAAIAIGWFNTSNQSRTLLLDRPVTIPASTGTTSSIAEYLVTTDPVANLSGRMISYYSSTDRLVIL